MRGIFIEEAEGPADLKSSEELSGTISVSEALLDWCSHWNVSALDVIEENSESTAATKYVGHEQITAVVGGPSIAAIGLQIDGILGGGGTITIREGCIGFKVIGVPIVTSFGSWRLPSHDSDRLAGCWSG